VPVGQGVNAPNIAACVQYLKQTDFDGVLEIESDDVENIQSSVDWLRKQAG
jgi:hypothetical protein